MAARVAAVVALVVALFAAFEISVSIGTQALEGRLPLRQRTWIEDHLLVARLRTIDLHGNEYSAIATLRNLTSSQAQFEAAAIVDEDRDGTGEYGTFHELSGLAPPRGRGKVLNPPMLSGAFRSYTSVGEVTRSGYLLRVWLTDRDGRPVGETAAGLAAGVADPDVCESKWRCYAWPAIYDHSGLTTFFVDETGDVFATEDARYSGTGGGPASGAASGRPNASATTYTGGDGNAWKLRN